MNNIEHIPSEVFNWLQISPFSELSEDNQKLVLNYLSLEEYNELHFGFVEAKQLIATPVLNHQRNKQTLLAHFDKHHAKKTYSSSLFLWRAAALLFLLLSGGLTFSLINGQNFHSTKQFAVADTVYVEREVKAEAKIIHDTVFLTQQINASTQKVNRKTAVTKQVVAAEPMIVSADVRAMGMQDMESSANRPKRNSMKHDSLLRKFSFVSL